MKSTYDLVKATKGICIMILISIWLIIIILLLSSCTKPNCTCGEVTETGTTCLGSTWVVIQTDCGSDKYIAYDTTRTWQVGEWCCVEELGTELPNLNLTITNPKP